MNQLTDKQAIRQIIRQRRRDFFGARAGKQWSLPEDRFGQMLDRGTILASYFPHGSEADPEPVVRMALGALATIAYPRVDADGLMRFYTFGPSRSLCRDTANMLAPGKDAWLSRPDVILLPLVAFDRTGTRLGQGGGHYDRAIAALGQLPAPEHTAIARPPIVRIGIAWSVQEHPPLPRDPWDIPLDHIITEQEWITP
ncbi:5-formyltetrahydrofolate cyclo-ligase [Sphingomonas lacunae]|uniref:5-formyltetrahydrofolate cyclo-ligase n=1 Tax=Sphingomonas lacunae TaxID=2698828 RepID=A0A6M4AWY4_9SPHN|nr:5-formyltetrahydrofolate cyclo-ligase [Sphingomonas lacunae]QJQ32890.1 5-formyltetrahydrofolate cyclo-ligase [Sphingomonas lacunae]